MSGTLSSMGSQNRVSLVWVEKPLKIDGTQAGLSVIKYFGKLEAWANLEGGGDMHLVVLAAPGEQSDETWRQLGGCGVVIK